MKRIHFSKIIFSAIACLFLIIVLAESANAQRRRRGAYYNSSEMMYSVGATAIIPLHKT